MGINTNSFLLVFLEYPGGGRRKGAEPEGGQTQQDGGAVAV